MFREGFGVADAVAAVDGDASPPERHLVQEEGLCAWEEDHGCLDEACE